MFKKLILDKKFPFKLINYINLTKITTKMSQANENSKSNQAHNYDGYRFETKAIHVGQEPEKW